MQKLTEILANCEQFTDPSHDDYVDIEKQEIYLKLAEHLQSAISHLYEDPEELSISTGIDDPELWEEFLNFEPVNLYIEVRQKKLTSVSARKAIKNLQNAANRGDVQAIKYLNEVSGILQAQGDNNKQIVLHFVPRPENAPKGLKSDGR